MLRNIQNGKPRTGCNALAYCITQPPNGKPRTGCMHRLTFPNKTQGPAANRVPCTGRAVFIWRGGQIKGFACFPRHCFTKCACRNTVESKAANRVLTPAGFTRTSIPLNRQIQTITTASWPPNRNDRGLNGIRSWGLLRRLMPHGGSREQGTYILKLGGYAQFSTRRTPLRCRALKMNKITQRVISYSPT